MTTPAERDYIAALVLRFEESARRAATVRARRCSRDAMRRLQRHPHDPDAATLFVDAAMTPRVEAVGADDAGTRHRRSLGARGRARPPSRPHRRQSFLHPCHASPAPERGYERDRLPRSRRLPQAFGAHAGAHLRSRRKSRGTARRKAAVAADDAYFRQLVAPNPYQGATRNNLHFAISWRNQGAIAMPRARGESSLAACRIERARRAAARGIPAGARAIYVRFTSERRHRGRSPPRRR
jgi:hypothetical protein